jgi:cytochrome c peroxidase
MDEVQIFAAAYPKPEIRKFALQKVTEVENTNVATNLRKPAYASKLAAKIPENNIYSQDEASIGKRLFNAKLLSQNRTVSCASCHIPQKNFVDNLVLSPGVAGTTARNTPSLLNAMFTTNQFWDSSAPSLESQVLHPILNGPEMGLDLNQILNRINQNPELSQKFMKVYRRQANYTLVAKALASYIRGLSSGAAAVDGTLSESALRGKTIFFERANCIACHQPPLFMDGKSHDIGLNPVTSTTSRFGDLGKYTWTKQQSDAYSMKTPALRNVSETAPYFHDGRAATLMDVVNFYNRGGDDESHTRSGRSLLVRPLNLTIQDQQDLVNFLKSLKGPVIDQIN